MATEELNHGVPAIIAGAAGIRRGMVRNPRLAATGALEEAVVAGPVVAIGAGENAPVGLSPRSRIRRVRAPVPRQKPKAVVLRPTVARRVRDIRLAADIQRRRSFVHGVALPLPCLVRLRDHVDRSR